MRDSLFVQENTLLTTRSDISREEDDTSTEERLHTQGIVHNSVGELLSANIIDRDAVPIRGWSEKEDIFIADELGLEHETGSEIILPDDIFRSNGWDILMNRVVTIRILIGWMCEELCCELSILIGLDDHTIVEKLRRSICLCDLNSFEKWLLVETKVIESPPFCVRESREEECEDNKKYEFFHIGYVIF